MGNSSIVIFFLNANFGGLFLKQINFKKYKSINQSKKSLEYHTYIAYN